MSAKNREENRSQIQLLHLTGLFGSWRNHPDFRLPFPYQWKTITFPTCTLISKWRKCRYDKYAIKIFDGNYAVENAPKTCNTSRRLATHPDIGRKIAVFHTAEAINIVPSDTIISLRSGGYGPWHGPTSSLIDSYLRRHISDVSGGFGSQWMCVFEPNLDATDWIGSQFVGSVSDWCSWCSDRIGCSTSEWNEQICRRNKSPFGHSKWMTTTTAIMMILMMMNFLGPDTQPQVRVN